MKRNGIKFNGYLAAIIRNLGYRKLAERVKDHSCSIYQDWRKSEHRDLYFRRFFNQSVRWRKRKFLTDLMALGPSAIKEISKLEKYKLEQRVANHFSTDSESCPIMERRLPRSISILLPYES